MFKIVQQLGRVDLRVLGQGRQRGWKHSLIGSEQCQAGFAHGRAIGGEPLANGAADEEGLIAVTTSDVEHLEPVEQRNLDRLTAKRGEGGDDIGEGC